MLSKRWGGGISSDDEEKEHLINTPVALNTFDAIEKFHEFDFVLYKAFVCTMPLEGVILKPHFGYFKDK